MRSTLMRWARRLLAAAALMVAPALLAPSPAAAAVVVAMDLEALTERADAIVLGTVGVTRSYWSEGDAGRILTDVEMTVEQGLRGAEAGSVVTFTVLGGRVGDLGQQVPGEASFQQGERALVFLERRGDGRLGVLGMRQGKFELTARPEDGVVVATRRLDGLSLVAPPAPGAHDASPSLAAPLEAAPVVLPELIERIEALTGDGAEPEE